MIRNIFKRKPKIKPEDLNDVFLNLIAVLQEKDLIIKELKEANQRLEFEKISLKHELEEKNNEKQKTIPAVD